VISFGFFLIPFRNLNPTILIYNNCMVWLLIIVSFPGIVFTQVKINFAKDKSITSEKAAAVWKLASFTLSSVSRNQIIFVQKLEPISDQLVAV
jgi:hypothetical protein